MTLTLTAGAGSIAFGTTAGYGLFGEVTRTFTAARRVVRDIPYGTANPYVDTLITGEIEWTLSEVRVTGSDADDLAAKLKALNVILTAAGTVTDQLAGGTASVTWVRNPALPILFGRTQHLEARSVWQGSVTFYTTVLGAGTLATPYTNESIAATPGLLSLGNLDGDAAPALDLTVKAAWTFAADGMHSGVVAVVETDALADYLYQAEDATGTSWTTYTHPAGGPGATNNTQYWESASWGDLVFGPVTAGTWRVIARAATAAGSGPSRLAISDDGSDRWGTATLDETGNMKLYDIGQFVSDGANSLHVMASTDSYLYVDWILLVPATSFAMFTYTGASDLAYWTVNAAPTFTLADEATTIAARRYMVQGQLTAPRAGAHLLVAVTDTEADEAEPAVTVSASYTPQHWTWASA